MRIYILFVGLLLFSIPSLAQKEKGKVIKAPKIPQNKKPSTSKSEQKEDEFDFTFEEEPKLRFSNQFENNNTNKSSNAPAKASNALDGIKIEPLREINELVSDDTSSIDEGELIVVEIEEDAQFSGAENMVKIASYFVQGGEIG